MLRVGAAVPLAELIALLKTHEAEGGREGGRGDFPHGLSVFGMLSRHLEMVRRGREGGREGGKSGSEEEMEFKSFLSPSLPPSLPPSLSF